ncbi:hypothetical protein [Solirubrobacter soli]|uniref:hypothetical protein n=1 Tax=Solirubrobacter soli TaxID=363832 RepID=UPI0004166FB7|nr:hypothetical protein [Solirubrobacter soli]
MDIDKVELKFTAVPADKGRVVAFLSDFPMKQRKVYFYDDEDLSLFERHVILRGRITDGEGDTTVKLRPVEPDVAGAAKDVNDDVRIELDVVGDDETLSAKLDHDDVDTGAIKQGEWDGLFTDEQKALAGDIDGIKPLGPIAARVWEIEDLPGFPYKLAAEEWSVHDLHFVELSIKVKPGDVKDAKPVFKAFLTGLVKDVAGDPSRKTEQVLRKLV